MEQALVVESDRPRSPDGGVSRVERARRTDALLRAAATDDGARSHLLGEVVVLNRRVADAVAARYRSRGVPLEDLQQAAYEGLVKAVQRFDAARADDLLTFAVPTIRGEVQRHFRDRSWMVRPPRRVQDLQTRANAAVGHLHELLGREPSTAELCSYLRIDTAEYLASLQASGCFQPLSLDRPVGDGTSGGRTTTVGDLVPDEHEEYGAAEARCVLHPLAGRLGQRDRRLLFLRYYEECSQREIGDELGLTQTQVSRLLERVLGRLRELLGPDGLAAPSSAATDGARQANRPLRALPT